MEYPGQLDRSAIVEKTDPIIPDTDAICIVFCAQPLYLSQRFQSLPLRHFIEHKSSNLGELNGTLYPLQVLRACFKIEKGPAARDFGCGQGGEAGASPQRAVTVEPTPAAGKRPAARRVFSEKADGLRCSSVTDRWRVCSLVAPRPAAFSEKTGPF